VKLVYSLAQALGIAVGLLVLIIGFAVFVTSCATERYAPAVDAKVDSTLRAAGLPPLSVDKLVFRGPVTFQVGQGNTSTTVGKDKTGQRAQAVSTGPGSPVTATTKKGGTPWWVFLLVAGLSIAAWQWLKPRWT
jgi:hypothetical protein